MVNEMLEIDKSFPSNYRCKVIEEMPNAAFERYYFPEGGKEGGRDGVLVSITPVDGNEWIGVFGSVQKYPKSLSKILSWPDDNKICVVSSGAAVIVDVNNPLNFELVGVEPIFHAIPIQESGIVVFADFTSLIAYNEKGIVWKSKRVSWDGLEIISVDQSCINGSYWDIKSESKTPFKVNIATGEVEGGVGESAF